MIEVYSRLFVGSALDYESTISHQTGWAVVHACKEPYHRQALGYSGRAAPNTHPEYLVAHRGKRLMLNIVDADNPGFFAKSMIDQALDFIEQQYSEELNVLVHCNQGESRGPSIALTYMAARLQALPNESLEAAEQPFKTLYPYYNPKPGIRGHIKQYWQQYCNSQRGDGRT